MPTKTLGFCQPCLLLVTRFHHFQNVHARNGSFNKYGHYVFSTKMNFSTAATVFMPTRYMYIYLYVYISTMYMQEHERKRE